MNRRDFLSTTGAALAAVAVQPYLPGFAEPVPAPIDWSQWHDIEVRFRNVDGQIRDVTWLVDGRLASPEDRAVLDTRVGCEPYAGLVHGARVGGCFVMSVMPETTCRLGFKARLQEPVRRSPYYDVALAPSETT